MNSLKASNPSHSIFFRTNTQRFLHRWFRNLSVFLWFFEHHPKRKISSHDVSVRNQSEWSNALELRNVAARTSASQQITPLPLAPVFWFQRPNSENKREVEGRFFWPAYRTVSYRSWRGRSSVHFNSIWLVHIGFRISKLNFLKAKPWREKFH